jgi:polysaccharide biosynthesis/export protein
MRSVLTAIFCLSGSSAWSTIAIAGGFSPRARRDSVTRTHTGTSGSGRFLAPLGSSLSPGDAVFVGERWF